ncbi:MAG TPA: hypothetical protein VHC47_08375 [Mucilaginibacter sp.]|nr:hypothetical protein [Mucilaginibacter sp.]
MKFSEVYNAVISFWGDEIDISDFIINEESYSLPNGDKYHGHSAYSKNLSLKWDEVEEAIGTNNLYMELMVWTMYQIFTEASKNLFLKDHSKLSPKDVDKKSIEKQYFKNLRERGWQQELTGYVNDLT